MELDEHFRRYAAECIRMAQETKNRADKAMWLSLAERWERLAENAVIRKRPPMKITASQHQRSL